MSFDRVAGIYDATRGLPEEVSDAVARRIMLATHATPETRFLELGIGSGRIALPILRQGVEYTGVDISSKMLAVLRQKLRGEKLELIEADATRVPLADHSFDVVLAVHLLHLVPNWHQVLAEARRLLAPGGYFVMGHDRSLPGTPVAEIRSEWWKLSQEGLAEHRQERGSWQQVEEALASSGGWTAVWQAARWSSAATPLSFVELLHARTFSASWDVPQPILESTHQKLQKWVRARYGDLHQSLESSYEFLISVTRWQQ
ncbi:MAG: methyltransferase domain-containing protein [Chloroflexota bacterium]